MSKSDDSRHKFSQILSKINENLNNLNDSLLITTNIN